MLTCSASSGVIGAQPYTVSVIRKRFLMDWFSVLALSSILLFIILVGLIWLNRGSDEIIKPLIPVLAALLFAIVSVVYYFVWPGQPNRTTVKVAIPFMPGPTLLPLHYPLIRAGSPRGQTYLKMAMALETVRRSQSALTPSDQDIDTSIGVGLLQDAFLEWLGEHYNIHWMMEEFSFEGISSSVRTGQKQEDAELETTIWRGIHLPKGSTVTLGNGTVTVTNCRLRFKVSIRQIMSARLGGSNLAERLGARFKLDHSSQRKVMVGYYTVTFDRSYTRLLRWAPSTERQRRWIDRMVHMYQMEFGWPGVLADLEKSLGTIEPSHPDEDKD